MMKKSILPIILISCLLLLAGCNKGQTDAANDGAPITKGKSTQASSVNDGQNQNMIYKVTRQTYTEKNIKAIYPQITGLSDKNKEDRINEMLKKKALGLCNFSQIDEVHAACDYEIKWQSANLLSIVYTGECQYDSTPHSNVIFSPFNVDIDTGYKIKLEDLVNIDEDFVAKVKAGEFKGVSSGIKITDIPELSNDKLLAEIRKVGYFYFTQDSLGINIIVPHTRGENGQFEVKYQDIFNKIKTENKVWKEFLN